MPFRFDQFWRLSTLYQQCTIVPLQCSDINPKLTLSVNWSKGNSAFAYVRIYYTESEWSQGHVFVDLHLIKPKQRALTCMYGTNDDVIQSGETNGAVQQCKSALLLCRTDGTDKSSSCLFVRRLLCSSTGAQWQSQSLNASGGGGGPSIILWAKNEPPK